MQLSPKLLQETSTHIEGASLDYFQARQIRDKLAATAEKNFFGYMTGPAGAWDKIVKAYEKAMVNMGEAGQTLVRYVDYEIPFLMKQAAKYQSQLQDLERKRADLQRSAATAAVDFTKECKDFGIEGVDIDREVEQLVRELPHLFTAALEALQSDPVADALAYYATFVAYAHPSALRDGAPGLLATLAAARADFVAGSLISEAEFRAERARAQAAAAAGGVPAGGEDSNGGGELVERAGSTSSGVQIDWDAEVAEDELQGEAGAAVPTNNGAAIEIDWDVVPEAAAEDAAGPADGASERATAGEAAVGSEAGINWDVDLGSLDVGEGAGAGEEDAGTLEVNWDIDITESADTEAMTSGAGAHVGKDAAASTESEPAEAAQQYRRVVLQLVEDSEYRSHFLDDLFELRAFLRIRRKMLSSGGNEMIKAAAPAPDAVQQVGLLEVERMLPGIEGPLHELTGERTQQLLMIKTSRRTRERVTRTLRQRAGQQAKFLRLADEAESRRREVQRLLMADAPKQAAMLQRVRSIKGEAEAALAALLNGRKVNIIGEINNLLQ